MAVSPREPWSFEYRGVLYLDTGNPDHALAMFRKALALNPKLPQSLAGIGKAFVRKGQPAKALPYLTKAVALEPDSANLHYQLGQAYLKAGDRPVGEKEMAEASRLQAAARARQADQLSGQGEPPLSGKLPPAPGPEEKHE